MSIINFNLGRFAGLVSGSKDGLKISLKEYELMTIARESVSDLAFLTKLFKLTHAISISSPDAELDPFEMQTLLNATGLAYEIVTAVLNTKFVNNDGSSSAPIA